MNIIRAQHLGMCFGVRDAIALAKKSAASEPLTVLGELVHNQTVLDDLQSSGIQIESRLDQVKTRRAMITAHGASQQRINAAKQHGFELLEATCPLVLVAHRAVYSLVQKGYYPVIIGKRDHVEVIGMTEDLEEFDVVLSADDVERLKEKPRFGIAAQTTQPIEKVRALVQLIRHRFPSSDIKFIDTVCQPTKQRQHSAEDLARKCDLVLVIGGAHSNNTQELVQTCSRYCDRVHHIQSQDDLNPDWWSPDETIGITAGTSTPDSLIDAVEQKLQSFIFTYER
ncbi:MAG: 4-hydroxy-3-methylbut-2-enyl diphosphate reductase [Verrucomicrobiales bacterium]